MEVGTFTGYGALSIALSLPQEGTVTSLDKDEKTSKKAEDYFKKANLDNKIKIILNNALESMKNLINKLNILMID